MMNVFWFSGEYESFGRGLYYYQAATWGDGLFLSVGAGALVAWLSAHPQCKAVGRKASLAVCILAACVGLAIQVCWLWNDNIQLNWTIPQPHVFNAAGWYHAVFFVGAFALFAWLLTRYWAVCHSAFNQVDPHCRALEILVWFGVAGYLSMHVLDDRSAFFGQPLACLAAALFAMFLVVVFYMSAKCGRSLPGGSLPLEQFFVAAPGVLLALGLSLALTYPNVVFSYQVPLGIALALLFAASITMPMGLPSGVSACYIAMGVAGIGFAMVVVSVSGTWSALSSEARLLAVAMCFIGVLLLSSSSLGLGPFHSLDARMVVVGAGAAAAGVVWAVSFNNPFWMDFASVIDIEIADKITHFILSFVVLGLLIYRAKGNVDYVRLVENTEGDYDNRRSATLRAQKVAYPQIGFMAAGALLLLLFDMLRIHPDTIGPISGPELLIATPDRIVALAMAVLLAAFAAFAIGAKECGFKVVVGVVLTVVAYAVVFFYVAGLRKPLSLDWWYAWSLFAPIGAALLVGESFVSDYALIRHRSNDSRVLVLAVVIVMGSYLVSMGCIVPTASPDGGLFVALWSPGIGLLGLVVANVIIPSFCILGLQMGHPDPKQYLVLNTPLAGVAQNGLSATIAVLLLSILPMALYAYAPVVAVIFVAFAIMAVSKVGKIMFPLSMNVRHLASRAADFEKLKVDREAALEELRALSRHLQRQAVITMTAFVPWVFFVIAIDAFVLHIRVGKTSYREHLWREYLLRVPSQETIMLFVELAPLGRVRYSEQLSELADQAILLTIPATLLNAENGERLA